MWFFLVRIKDLDFEVMSERASEQASEQEVWDEGEGSVYYGMTEREYFLGKDGLQSRRQEALSLCLRRGGDAGGETAQNSRWRVNLDKGIIKDVAGY